MSARVREMKMDWEIFTKYLYIFKIIMHIIITIRSRNRGNRITAMFLSKVIGLRPW